MRQDRFLTGILIFIAVLVVAAVALFFFRQRGELSYGPEDTPEGTVHNYVVALVKRDYSRAYGYLASDPSKPDLGRFQQAVVNMAAEIGGASLQIHGHETTSTGDTIVYLTITRSPGGLFSDPYREDQTALLTREGGAWKIKALPYPYWAYDWYQPEGPVKAVPASP